MPEDVTPSKAGPLVGWLRERDLLRGPFVFVDYWASVLALEDRVPERLVDNDLVSPRLFRIGLDRPDLEIPRSRAYLALFLVGPLLLPFRAFRRLGKYRMRFRRAIGERVLGALAPYRLETRATAPGRVSVSRDGETLAEDVLDPTVIGGFSSLFYAVYKLPIATVTGVVAMATVSPFLARAGWLPTALDLWFPVVVPAVVLLLYILYRDWPTSFLGAIPLVIGRYLLTSFGPSGTGHWTPFLLSLAALLALLLLMDWFFIPRPVPPVLMLYTRTGPARAYDHPGDEPYWLDGDVYWVWRYLMLSPAELNKFWEKDWERVELWVRADGEHAGRLEWVVADAHYRELWMPLERLGRGDRLREHAEQATKHAAEGKPGIWLVEADANLIFHAPMIRAVSFLSEGSDVPVRSLWHLLNGLFRRARRDDPDDYMEQLDLLRIQRGSGILDDMPEAIIPYAARHMLSVPWTHWRYPLGAHRRWDRRLYERRRVDEWTPAADPELQIKAREAE